MADTASLDAFARLVDIMTRLRAPGGCPWDREQTPDSLRPYLLEEACEVIDAIATGDDAAICDELGDLLLQVVFHAEIAREEGRFTIADVATAIAEKLVRRHPHVFGDVVVQDSAEVLRNWQEIKAAERGNPVERPLDRVDRVSRALPALARAEEVGRKAAKLGFDWPDVAGVRAKVAEEQTEVEQAIASGDRTAIHHEIGDLLLAVTSLARHLDVAPELALRDATNRFTSRLHQCQVLAEAEGHALSDYPLAELDRLWEHAKALEGTTRAPLGDTSIRGRSPGPSD